MIKDVASAFATSQSVVSLWRDRFIENGPYALYDQDRPGRGGNAKKGTHEKVVARIQEHKETDPPLSAKSLAKEFGVSKTTIFRILEQEDISLYRQHKWYLGFTVAPQPKTIDMTGLFLSDKARMMIICSNQEGLLPDVRGVMRTQNKALADFLMETALTSSPDLIDLLKFAKEYQNSGGAHPSRYDENLFLKTAFEAFPVDEAFAYTIYVHQEHPIALSLAIPGLRATLKRIESTALWNENVALVYDLLSSSGAKHTGADLMAAMDDFTAGYSSGSEPFTWIKRKVPSTR